MNDRDKFEFTMTLMGMVGREKTITEGILVLYDDDKGYGGRIGNFSKQGYEEFYAGALYTEEGKMLLGFLDSHVATASEICKQLGQLWANN